MLRLAMASKHPRREPTGIADLENRVKKLTRSEEGSAEAEQLAETIYLRQRIRERVTDRIASLEAAVNDG